MLLEVRRLAKRFKDVEAVRGVSFEIEPGETLGLVGESGCGKSTLARLAARLLEPDAGEIYFENREISHKGQKELFVFRYKVQIVFQNPFSSFDPRLRVGDSLGEALRLGGETSEPRIRERAQDLLRSVELPPELAGRFPHELSGGECQSVAIARALSRNPGLLICDEPVSSLDLLAQARILNLFLRLQKQNGISLLFISHDLRVIRHLCDRVLVMKEGSFCEEGPISQVFENPRHPYTQELLVSAGFRAQA